MEYSLINLTLPEVQERLARRPVVVIPTGSVEQHGAHLPFGTDYFAARLFGQRLAVAIGALLLPFTPLGVTPIHMSFAGTISLRPDTYMALLRDVVDSMARHGARRVIVVNWHELNDPLIRLVATDMQQSHPVRFVVVQAHYVMRQLYGQTVGLTHGGLLEVLPVLVHDPGLVRLDQAGEPSPHGRGNKMDRLRRRLETYTVFHDVAEVYPAGWYGSLEGASEAYAHEVVAGVSAQIATNVQEALAALDEMEGGAGRAD